MAIGVSTDEAKSHIIVKKIVTKHGVANEIIMIYVILATLGRFKCKLYLEMPIFVSRKHLTAVKGHECV